MLLNSKDKTKGERLQPRSKTSGKSKISKMRFWENFNMFWMVLPGLILLILFNYLPMPGIVMAFKKFNPIKGVWGSPWNGLDNFKFFFTSPDAYRVIRNTLLYSFAFLVTDVVFPVALALMFYFLRSNKSLKFYNTVVILPRFMSSVIVAFIVYTILSPTTGLANQLLRFFGMENILWYQEPKHWPIILTIVHIWQIIGMQSIFYYASLMGMDETLLEAAEMDGANRWQQICHILIPHLLPIMTVTTILAVGHIMNGDIGLFNQVTKDQGMLYPTTDIISTYTYRMLTGGNLAQSAAVGLFQSVVGLIMVIITNLIVKKVSPENSLF